MIFWNLSTLSGLRQFLANESPLKMMKNAFYFTLTVVLVVKIFKFLCWLFGHLEKRLGEKHMVNFQMYDITAWKIDNYNAHIAWEVYISRTKDN